MRYDEGKLFCSVRCRMVHIMRDVSCEGVSTLCEIADFTKRSMQLKVILVGLAIFGLIAAESDAMSASSSSEDEARADPETAERAEQGSTEEARISGACLASLCG
ncbi:uncharacterized protein [Dermacentor albipictus]|uniref:uncharacterized protein n=1 Tax=Dermacentor albipictus TaxID=60249 RepID=UPI0038FC200F